MQRAHAVVGTLCRLWCTVLTRGGSIEQCYQLCEYHQSIIAKCALTDPPDDEEVSLCCEGDKLCDVAPPRVVWGVAVVLRWHVVVPKHVAACAQVWYCVYSWCSCIGAVHNWVSHRTATDTSKAAIQRTWWHVCAKSPGRAQHTPQHAMRKVCRGSNRTSNAAAALWLCCKTHDSTALRPAARILANICGHMLGVDLCARACADGWYSGVNVAAMDHGGTGAAKHLRYSLWFCSAGSSHPHARGCHCHCQALGAVYASSPGSGSATRGRLRG